MEDWVSDVLDVVESVPVGRVTTYGAIAAYLDLPSARMVGRVMSQYGGAVPWHRVVNAAGRLVPGHEDEARARLMSEGVLLRDTGRVSLSRYGWEPGV